MTSSRSLGTCSGSAGSAGGRSGGFGSRSYSSVMISAPEAPSIAEWWILATNPIRFCLTPSMTQISQSGRVRSRGIDAI